MKRLPFHSSSLLWINSVLEIIRDTNILQNSTTSGSLVSLPRLKNSEAWKQGMLFLNTSWKQLHRMQDVTVRFFCSHEIPLLQLKSLKPLLALDFHQGYVQNIPVTSSSVQGLKLEASISRERIDSNFWGLFDFSASLGSKKCFNLP